MKKPSDADQANEAIRRKLIGLGEKSLRKSYYPALRARLAELERFRALLDQSHDAILLIEAEQRRIVDANQSACDQLRLSLPELLKKPVDDLLICRASPRLEAFILDTLGRNESQEEGICEFLLPDRTTIPMEIKARRVVFDVTPYIVVVGRDITERRRAEEERKYMEALLIRAQKLEAIGTLAGGIAHDFNNILGAILGFTELALYRVSNNLELGAELAQVIKACDRAKLLIKQILSFSRQNVTQKKPIVLAPIVLEVEKFLRALIPTTIEFMVDVQAADDLVMADATQMHQVLMNLCTNAAHAMKDKAGILKIDLRRQEIEIPVPLLEGSPRRKNYLEMVITDTGHGMKPEIIDRIFDPFFTTKAPGEGSGMGLSVVHGIIQDHEGRITVSSTPEEGSSFVIQLPVLEMELGTKKKQVEDIQAVGGHERILFVDDEKALTEIGREYLEILGYSVVATTSSPEALALFQAAPNDFDAVITDQTMPGMTGLELARNLKSIRPFLPIIICSGFSEDILDRQSGELGRIRFLPKPILIRELGQVLREVLTHS
jgi:PAS domain S-box-containing protein